MKNFTEYLKENGNDQNKALAAFAADIRADEAQKAIKSLKVSVSKTTGVVMVLGLNSFPTSLYADQWKRLADFIPSVIAYIAANGDEIAKIESAAKEAKSASKSA